MILLIKPEDIFLNTYLQGNIDETRLIPIIANVQTLNILPLLGKSLYSKILTDFDTNALSGKYNDLYNNYLIDIISNLVASEYVIQYREKDDVTADLIQKSGNYTTLADSFIISCNSFLESAGILEYSEKKDTSSIGRLY